jgi:hypothetical protein
MGRCPFALRKTLQMVHLAVMIRFRPTVHNRKDSDSSSDKCYFLFGYEKVGLLGKFLTQ